MKKTPIAKAAAAYRPCYCVVEPGYIFQDRAGTIPAVNVGDHVEMILDQTGNGNNLYTSEGEDWALGRDADGRLWVGPVRAE